MTNRLNRTRRGAISVVTALSLAGGLMVGVASSVIWITNSISQAVAPVQAESAENAKDIAVIQAKLDEISWIKAALEANGITPSQSFLTKTK